MIPHDKRRFQEAYTDSGEKIKQNNSKEEWCSTENQLASGCQGRILQVPQKHWRLFLTETIDAYEGQNVMVLDFPNVLIQTNITPNKYGKEKVIMKITGYLVDMLVKMDSDTYSKQLVLKI